MQPRFWATSSDLGLLFSAEHICFLVGSHDGRRSYGAALQLAGALSYLRWLPPSVLPVFMLNAANADDYGRLRGDRLIPSGRACFLLMSVDPEIEQTAPDAGLTEVLDAPSASAQVVVYGGSGGVAAQPDLEESSAAVKRLRAWLSSWSGAEEASSSVSVTVVGAPSSALSRGESDGSVEDLLGGARVIGLVEEPPREDDNGHVPGPHAARTFVSGEEGENLLLAGERVAPAASAADRDDVVVNLEVSPAGEVEARVAEYVGVLLDALGGDEGRPLLINLLEAEPSDAEEASVRLREAAEVLPRAGEEARVRVVDCLVELREGFTEMAQADLTLASSRHVALTSLALEVPVIALDERASLPSLADLEVLGSDGAQLRERLAESLSESVSERFRSMAARARTRTRPRAAAAALITSNSVAAGSFASLQSEHADTVGRLRESIAELSDLRYEYERLLNAFPTAQPERSSGAPPIEPASRSSEARPVGPASRSSAAGARPSGRSLRRTVRGVSQLASWLRRPSRDSFRSVRAYWELRRSGYFDADFYLASYRDVARAGVDPLMHYIEHGWHSGRDPNAQFSSAGYLEARPDVARSGMNPLLHFVRYGQASVRERESSAGPANGGDPTTHRAKTDA